MPQVILTLMFRRGFSTILVVSVMLFLACGDSDSPDLTPSAIVRDPSLTSQTAPSETATPTIVVPDDAAAIRFGGITPFPDDVALIVETGCYACDGGATGYWRVYRDPSGEIRADRLGPSAEGSLHGFASNALAGGMAMAFCTRGECSGNNPSTGDEQNTTYWSRDGGMTWAALAVTDGFFSGPRVVLRDGVVVEDGEDGLRLMPAGTTISAPANADPTRGPYAASSDELAWVHADGRAIVALDGTELVRVDNFRVAAFFPLDGVNRQRRFLLLPRAPEGTPTTAEPAFVTALEDGTIDERYAMGFHQVTRLGGTNGGSLLFGNTDVDEPLANPYLPSVINLQADTLSLSLIEEHFAEAEGFVHGRNHIRDVIVGPFARVVAPLDCVNVRIEPAATATALECAADGVLLVDLGESREADRAMWRRVATPAGNEGWASEEFLER